ncbi:YegP family protein, partial [Pseudomonas aeruginosa]
MAAKVPMTKAKAGQSHSGLHAAYCGIILSSELYKAKASALGGKESMSKICQRDGAFKVKPDSHGKFHFVIKGS